MAYLKGIEKGRGIWIKDGGGERSFLYHEEGRLKEGEFMYVFVLKYILFPSFVSRG